MRRFGWIGVVLVLVLTLVAGVIGYDLGMRHATGDGGRGQRRQRDVCRQPAGGRLPVLPAAVRLPAVHAPGRGHPTRGLGWAARLGMQMHAAGGRVRWARRPVGGEWLGGRGPWCGATPGDDPTAARPGPALRRARQPAGSPVSHRAAPAGRRTRLGGLTVRPTTGEADSPPPSSPCPPSICRDAHHPRGRRLGRDPAPDHGLPGPRRLPGRDRRHRRGRPAPRPAWSGPTCSSSTWACPTATASMSPGRSAGRATCPSSCSPRGPRRPTRSSAWSSAPTTTSPSPSARGSSWPGSGPCSGGRRQRTHPPSILEDRRPGARPGPDAGDRRLDDAWT